jgi:hypothetical protein
MMGSDYSGRLLGCRQTAVDCLLAACGGKAGCTLQETPAKTCDKNLEMNLECSQETHTIDERPFRWWCVVGILG